MLLPVALQRGVFTRWLLALSAVALTVWFLLVAEPDLLVNGLLLGGTLSLGAIGLTLIFGILRFAHIAHGDFMTTGAYITFFLLTWLFPKVGLEGAGLGPFTFGYPLLLALPLAALVLSGLAIGIDHLVYRRLRSRGSHVIVMTMASLGVAIALRGAVQMLWGTQPEHYPRVSRQFFLLSLAVRLTKLNSAIVTGELTSHLVCVQIRSWSCIMNR